MAKYTGCGIPVIFEESLQGPNQTGRHFGMGVTFVAPGRLLDLMNQGFISLKKHRVLFLDEADSYAGHGLLMISKKDHANCQKKAVRYFSLGNQCQITLWSFSRKNSFIIHKKGRSKVKKSCPSTAGRRRETINPVLYYTNKGRKKIYCIHTS